MIDGNAFRRIIYMHFTTLRVYMIIPRTW